MKEKDGIFEKLKGIADITVRTFGRHCEVAIHDLTDMKHSLIHISGDVTHRKPGAPITDLVVKALRREGDSVRDISNYRTKTRNGRVLKSSTSFIRDRNGKVVGAFCINFDTTDYLNSSAVIDELIATTGLNSNERSETFATSAEETIESLIEEGVTRIGKQPSTMVRKEKLELVQILEDMGMFIIKGAVDHVALTLGMSRYSVYNYLKEVRRNKKNGVFS